MTSTHLFLLFSLLLTSMAAVPSTVAGGGGNYTVQWCTADEQTPDDVLQSALDWACGKAELIVARFRKGAACYLPNTVKDHASYAFNSYWQKTKHLGGSCFFDNAALVTDLDPSHGNCKFETVD